MVETIEQDEVIINCAGAAIKPGSDATDAAGAYHQQRLADGFSCQRAALRYRSEFHLSSLCLCPCDHLGVGRAHGSRCKPKSWGKSPWGPWKQFQDTLPTVEELAAKWRDLPTANVGVALGPVSGVVRLDVEGEAAWHQLQELSGGDLPATWEFRSGRADGTGRGTLYAIPAGVVFRTTPQFFQDGELRFQAKGAQTALPPSRHRDGGLYEWLPGRGPGDVALAPAPRWAVARWGGRPAAERRPRPAAGTSSGGPADSRAVALALQALDHLDPGRAVAYDSWLRVGMALHSVSDAEDMLRAWDEWSQEHGGDKYAEDVCAEKWATFSADAGLQPADLLRWAGRDSGWVPPRPEARVFRRRGGRFVVVVRGGP